MDQPYIGTTLGIGENIYLEAAAEKSRRLGRVQTVGVAAASHSRQQRRRVTGGGGGGPQSDPSGVVWSTEGAREVWFSR